MMWRRTPNFNRAWRKGRVFFAGALISSVAAQLSAQDYDRMLERNCMGCHASGIAGAPRYGVAADWTDRIQADGWETMVRRGWEGVGRMPPKGYCYQCSASDFEQLVRQMVPASALPDTSPP